MKFLYNLMLSSKLLPEMNRLPARMLINCVKLTDFSKGTGGSYHYVLREVQSAEERC